MTAAVTSIIVRSPAGDERVIDLGPDPITFGRDPTSTVRLESPYVSRQHARIELQGGAATLVDLGSRNGSLLNGERISGSMPLTPGDVVTFADTVVECLAEPATLEMTRALGPGALPRPPGGQAGLTPGIRAGAPQSPQATPVPDAPSAPDDLLRVDSQTYEVTLGGRPLQRRLSAQEFQLLSYLYEHRDRVCTRQELGDAIWGRDNWDPNMLHRLVHRLKEKLEPQPDHPRYVQTVPWVGYRATP